MLYPASCDLARGDEGIDYMRGLVIDGLWDHRTCWYSLERFRAHFPEYGDVPDELLGQRLYEKSGRPLASLDPWGYIGFLTLLGLLPPAILLALGRLWVGRSPASVRLLSHDHASVTHGHHRRGDCYRA